MHVDMDAFYPSVEILRNPSLKGLPVIVGADPQGGKGRGVVTSCSYEARKFGVRSAMPISQAYRLCPQAVYLRPDFELYGTVSERVMEILRRYAGKFEQVSIDEAFLDVSDRVVSYDEAEAYAKKVKEEILRTEHLTCSVGIAANKSVAKIASDHQKPDGLAVIRPEDAKEFLSPLPVRNITGVGPKTQEFLKGLGIETIGQLAQCKAETLMKKMGKAGLWLWTVANGLEEEPVEERWERRSIGSEVTFPEDVSDRSEVLKAFDSLVDEVSERAAAEGFMFKTVGIKVRFRGFETFTRERSLMTFFNDKEIIRKVVRTLFEEFEGDDRPIRLVGVRISRLKAISLSQPSLDTWA